MPIGSVLHPGAGGINYWIDFANEIVGVFFEVITEIDEFLTPISGIGHRFADVITGGGDRMTFVDGAARPGRAGDVGVPAGGSPPR